MKKLSLKIFCLLFILITVPFGHSHAQISSVSNINLNISVNPSNPAPGDQVTVSLQSYSLDLDRAKITWSVNGIVKQTDIGLKNYHVQAGKAGIQMTVDAQIESVDGVVLNKEISFIPAGVDLLFEAVSYVPPFYKGKAMNTNQGTVVVVAFPEMFDLNGKKFATQDLIYNWKKDDVVLPSVSGIGKNYLTFTGTVPIRDAKISVTVSSLDQSITADNTVTITAISPKIIFYENSPIYGIMTNKAITDTVKMLTDEFSVLAVPYFFSVGYATTPDLTYAWTLNGQTVDNQNPVNSFTVRQDTKGAGTADIGLKINNNNRIFQFTDNSFSINFQKQ